MISLLKSGVVVSESLPQFGTNVAAITIQILYFPSMNSLLLQKVSICTTFFTAIITMTNWVKYTNESDLIVSNSKVIKTDKYNSLCLYSSILAVIVWISCNIITTGTSPIYYPFHINPDNKPRFSNLQVPFYCSIINFLFVAMVILLSRWCSNTC